MLNIWHNLRYSRGSFEIAWMRDATLFGEGRQSNPHQRIPGSPQRLWRSDGCARFLDRFPSFLSRPCLWPVQGWTWPCMWMLEAAIESQHVASQMRSLPWAQGVMIIPSGCLPSERYSPGSSNTDGMLALVRDCLMMVFYWLWRRVLHALLWQLKSCSPVSSTLPPQWVQVMGIT